MTTTYLRRLEGQTDTAWREVAIAGSENPETSMEHLNPRWKSLHLRLVRRFGQIEYAAAVELQKRGSPHLHVLVRGPQIPTRWLSRAASGVGFGSKVDVRRAASSDARYLTKALGPGTSGDCLPTHFRRIRWSRGWSLPVVRVPRHAWQAWRIATAGTQRAASLVTELGYRVVEYAPGPPDHRPLRLRVRILPISMALPR